MIHRHPEGNTIGRWLFFRGHWVTVILVPFSSSTPRLRAVRSALRNTKPERQTTLDVRRR